MAEQSDYLDLNQGLWRRSWDQALAWDDYLTAEDPKHQDRWRAALELTSLTAEQAELLATFTRTLHCLVLSGAWCGDCVRQGPILHRLGEAAPTLEVRFIDRDAAPELTDLLRLNGAKKVPVAVFLSEDFFEVGRFGDRTLSVYRAKAKREVGAACETGIVPPETDALATEIQEWVDLSERMHLLLRTAPLVRRRYND